MKIALIIIDGLGDEPLSALNGKTPLEVAHIPHLHYIASRGYVGNLQTTFPDYPIESLVCIMGLLGYEPQRYYPSGRAAFEALAQGIPITNQDLVLRCNTVTIDPEKQILTDFTAGMISDSESRRTLSKIMLPFPNWELHPGQSYRNLLIVRNAGCLPSDIKCFEPHMHIGCNVRDILPQARKPEAKSVTKMVSDFLLSTHHQLRTSKLNNKANMLWVWSPSSKPQWPSFQDRTSLHAAMVAGLDFLHGIAMAADIHFDVIPGATGYIDTNYAAKAQYSLRYLQDYDFVLTHINAADEAAHQHDPRTKIEAIERTDSLIIGPIHDYLRKHFPNDYTIIVCGDHTTRCSDGKHTDALTPLAIYRPGITASRIETFSEAISRQKSKHRSLDLLQLVSSLQ